MAQPAEVTQLCDCGRCTRNIWTPGLVALWREALLAQKVLRGELAVTDIIRNFCALPKR